MTIAGVVALGPLFALFGNAISDIWLGLVITLFIGVSIKDKDWKAFKTPWFLVMVAFWLWAMMMSFISPWVEESLRSSLPWIRFPLFALAFAGLFKRDERIGRWLIYAMIAGLIIMMAVMLVQFFNSPENSRLYGTFRQNVKGSWYYLGFGLPAMLWAMGETQKNVKAWIWAMPLVVAVMTLTVISGGIYIAISLAFGLGLFILISRYFDWQIILAIVIIAVLAVLALSLSDHMMMRLRAYTSDGYGFIPKGYVEAWRSYYLIGIDNWFLGIGPENGLAYCKTLDPAYVKNVLGTGHCFLHPHNLYLQYFTDTGIVGLILFSISAVMILIAAGIKNGLKRLSANHTAALSIVIVALWPLSSFSGAFGQHRNFFVWFLIAWGLALYQNYKSAKS